MLRRFELWWRREAGGREVLRVAAPLVISSLSWTIMTFIDRAFLTWWSQDALAASFPASLLWWTVNCLPLGLCMYANTFVSQSHGAGKNRDIGPWVWQAIWLAVAATPLLWSLGDLGYWLFRLAGHEAAVLQSEDRFFRVLLCGSGGMLISHAQSAFYSGRGRTMLVMWIDAAAAVCNIGLDYCWIFGRCGFSAGGIEGAAWATVVSFWLKVAVYGLLMLARPHREEFHSLHWRPRAAMLLRMLRFGVPNGLQMFLEVLGFTGFVFIVGSLGTDELSATNLAFNVSTLAFMPIFGLAQAVSILVGSAMGAGRPDLAARATYTTLWLALGYMGVVSLLYVVLPDLFLFGFFAYGSEQYDVQVRLMAIVLLRFVAAYNLFDAMNLIFAFAVKGAGDTLFVSFVSLGAGLVLAGGAWLGIHRWGFGLQQCWTLLTLWIASLGCIYMARFRAGAWRNMQVL